MEEQSPHGYVEYRCESCQGQWTVIDSMTSHAAATFDCPSCAGVGEAIAVHEGVPAYDFGALASREFEARRRPRHDAPRAMCPFCGVPLIDGENKTREHVLARWLRGLPPLVDSLEGPRNGARRWIQGRLHVQPERLVLDPPRMLTSKAEHELFITVDVCGECNTGWMSRLENASIPILTPLINGHADTIRTEQARTLARWVGKVMVAWEQDDPVSARAHAAQIRDVRLGRPPRWSELWISRKTDPAETMIRHTAFEVRVNKMQHVAASGSRTYIGLGSLALMLLAADVPAFNFDIFVREAEWIRVWPPTADTMTMAAEGVSTESIAEHDRRNTVRVPDFQA